MHTNGADRTAAPPLAAWYLDYDTMRGAGTGSFTFRHAVMLCPGYDWSGPFDVVGEAGVMRAGAAGWSWLPYRARFTVSGIPTTTTLEAINVGGESATFVGRTAASPSSSSFHGCGGGGANVEKSAGGDWEGVGWGNVGTDGSFAVSVPTHQLTGTQYRVTFSGGTICAESSSEARALPVRLPTAKVESVSQHSKLRVDIDPNRGKKSWTFRVQRQRDDGTWRTLRTYRTQGSRETRTINLGKGTYRVHVPAQHGYAQTFSDTTWLVK